MSLWSLKPVMTSRLFFVAVSCLLVGMPCSVQAQLVGPIEQNLIQQGVRDTLLYPGGVLTVPSPARPVNSSQTTPTKESEYEWDSESPKVCDKSKIEDLTFSGQGEYGVEKTDSTARKSAESSDC
jgi:hypothetical protein